MGPFSEISHSSSHTKERQCQVQVYSSRGSGKVRMETDEGKGQRLDSEVSPAGVEDRLDSMTMSRSVLLDDLTRRSRGAGD